MVNCIVLAGGKSSRLGRDKVCEIVGEQILLQRVISSLKDVGDQIIIVSAEGKNLPLLTSSLPVRVVTDLYPDKGALGGVFTGLIYSDSFHSVVAAGDMPFLNAALLRYLISLSPGFDLVIPMIGGLLEPLHAVYSRNCLSPIEELLRQDRLQVLEFFPRVKVRYVEQEDIDRIDPQHLSLFNINTQAELDEARLLLERGFVNAQR